MPFNCLFYICVILKGYMYYVSDIEMFIWNVKKIHGTEEEIK